MPIVDKKLVGIMMPLFRCYILKTRFLFFINVFMQEFSMRKKPQRLVICILDIPIWSKLILCFETTFK